MSRNGRLVDERTAGARATTDGPVPAWDPTVARRDHL